MSEPAVLRAPSLPAGPIDPRYLHRLSRRRQQGITWAAAFPNDQLFAEVGSAHSDKARALSAIACPSSGRSYVVSLERAHTAGRLGARGSRADLSLQRDRALTLDQPKPESPTDL